MSRLPWCIPPFLVLAILLGRLPAQEPDKVKDDAKLFKAETVAKANDVVRDLTTKGIRLVIETYPTVPPGMPEKIKEVNAETREKIFEEWSKMRLKKLGANAFDIVITNDPKHLQVTMGPDVVKKGFSPEDRRALTKAMLEHLKKGEMDAALLDALAMLQKRLDAPPK
jgi:hypothetical protein